MTDRIADLQRRMDDAAAALDFETASRCATNSSILRGAEEGIAPVDTAGLTRQQPGAMGLGTSQQRMTPPPGWVKPRKPDPMTRGRPRPKRKG